jgi:hypothetical protein
MSFVKNNSSWKDINSVSIKVNGQWKKVTESFIKVNGSWKQTTFASAPDDKPNMTWHATGVFRVTNYDPSLYYGARFVSGSGSWSFNNGFYTLNGANSAFEVYSSYFNGGSLSPLGYIQRTPITYTYIAQCNYNQETCYREINQDYGASYTDYTRTFEGDTSSCAMYGCRAGYTLTGPDVSNRCLCVRGYESIYLAGGGQCPGGPWYVCSGNRCCYNYTDRVYSCPSGGNLSGTTCVRRTQESYDCSYYTPCNNKNPLPAGYTESGGEWWRVTR